MRAESFLDTNVLVYAFAGAAAEAAKRRRAVAIMEAGTFGISAQVLQELYVTVTRKVKRIIAPQEALAWIELLDPVPCVALDADMVKLAIAMSVQYRVSYWDGAVLAAAHELGASTLFTEDLNDGQLYGLVRAVNPFAGL
jgi:predicted nucleic acid-binding protein